MISNRAHITTNLHREADGFMEARKGDNKIGTTKQGIGPSYATKALRNGLRVGDLIDWDSFVIKFNHFVETSKDIFGLSDD